MDLYRKQYPILGISITFKTSSREVVDLIEDRFGHWVDLPSELIRPEPPMSVTIHELPNSSVETPSEIISFSINNTILHGKGSGIDVIVDRLEGTADFRLESKIITLTDFIKHDILGAIVRFLIFPKDRVPLHASTLIRDETALIIYGRSGSGKSTLSYQLMKRGADILSESAVFIASEKEYRLWGDVEKIFLRPDSKEIFPELANFPDKKLPNGKTKIQIPIPFFGPKCKRRLFFSGPMILILLERSEDRHSRLIKTNQQDIIEKLYSERESGFDLSDNFYDTIKYLPLRNTYILKSGNDLIHKAELLENLCEIKPK